MSTRITQHIRPNVVLSFALLAALVVSALALAPRAEAFVYWTGPDGIGRADLDGSDPDPDFTITGVGTRGLAVDADHIYWADAGGSLGLADIDGSDPDPNFITGISASSIAVDADHVYWTNNGTGTIGRANLDGTGKNQSFITDLGTPSGSIGLYLTGIAVDADRIYWTAFNIDSGMNIVDPRIGRANLDGSDPDPSFIDTLGNDIAVDADHIYWTAGYSIGRADLGGTNVDPNFISGLPKMGGLAVDADHIYWAKLPDVATVGRTIGRADLDGTGVDQSFITGVDASDVAVDALTFPETTITSGPEGPTNDATASFAFSSDHPGATFECRLDSAPFALCVSPKSYEDLPDGPHTFRVRATDPGGYADPSPASRKFTVDTKVKGEASAEKAQAQSGAKIVVEAKVKAKEDLDAKGTGKVKIRRRDGCLVGRESEPKPCKVGFKLQRVNKRVGSGKTKTLKLKATDAGNRRLVKLVEKGRKAKAKLKIELTDEAGNKETTKLRVKLKRAG